MKREHQEENSGTTTDAAGLNSLMAEASGKTKMWEETVLEQEANDDELLAVLGYKVRSSEMAEVAQKLEQLETVMGNTQEDALLSHLSSDTVHYNPSDLSTWLQSMLSELNPPTHNFDPTTIAPQSSSTIDFPNSTKQQQQQQQRQQQQTQIYNEPSSSDYDLRAIPFRSGTIYTERENKRLKQQQQQESSSTEVRVLTESTRPVVLIDSQETGIRLVHTLMACAEAVQQESLKLAEALVKQIGSLAVSQAGAMKKVATYFAEALARRIYRIYPQPSLESALSDLLEMHFYETCPYLKFAHFTANQAILEAFSGNCRVHVIDFSMKQGLQWPALMQALALRPGGPPTFRLTGIGPPQPDNTDTLHQVGWKLAQFAETIHVEFEFKGFVTNSLADLDASMLEIRSSEAVAVNSVFELHRLLAQPGSIDKVMSSIKEMKPKIVTIVEQEVNHNGPVFLDRFMESLHYYSTLFDSLEGCGVSPCNSEDLKMSEVYLGQQICNVVACEGVDRVERHETLTQWRSRFGSAGFVPVHLGSNAFKEASMLLALFAGGYGYRVEENNGCLMLGWHTRPLIATSAWQLASFDP